MSTCDPKSRTASSRSSSLGIGIAALTMCCLTTCVQSAFTDGDVEIISGDYCHAEVFQASCDGDAHDGLDDSDETPITSITTASGILRVIVVEKAQYGRMELGRCVEVDLMGHLGCHTDVLGMVDRRCSGRRRCEIRVPDAELENTRPCLRELKTYLHIEYRCVPVEMVTADRCRTSNVLPVSQPTSGFIASVVTSDTPWCADGRRPWLIQGEAGQQISLTLYDFFSNTNSAASPSPWQPATTSGDVNEVASNVRIRPIQKRNKTVAFVGFIEYSTTVIPTKGRTDEFRVLQTKQRCREYAIIQDGDGGEMSVLCGGTRRVNEVYKSAGNVVKIWIRAGIGPKDFQRFLIAYNVIGCADPVLTSHTWFRRASNEHAISGCLTSDNIWSMDCKNGTWQGPSHNCSPTVVPRDAGSTWRLSYGDDEEVIGNEDETELAIAAIEPPLTPTTATDHFILFVLSGLVGTVVLLIAVAALLARLATVTSHRPPPAPKRSPTRIVDQTADQGGDDGCFKATSNVDVVNAEYQLADGFKKPSELETVIIADRADLHVSCWCNNSHTVIPTSGRYHLRHQAEEVVEETTTTTNSSVLWRSFGLNSRLPQPVPSVSATIEADSKPPPSTATEHVNFTKYGRTEWLLPVSVTDAPRLRPEVAVTVARGGTQLPQHRLASSFTVSPV